MIKKFIDKLLGKTSAPASKFGKRVDIGPEVHRIDPKLVDERAIDVVQTLQQSGYAAYVVGGAVRDLLLGLRPKDFDVATNATPEEVKRLFRRAFIIGRRFRIVHVVYGRGREHEVIEVSTFRAHLDSADAEQVKGNEKTSKTALAGMVHAVDASGRVLRDNVWGPQDEDAARRDFTVNAMYYDPTTQMVVDYHNGLKDAQKKTLKLIGDPATRYREDPVRIIRAVRFSAKLAALGFSLDKKTAEPLLACAKLLADVPQSRMFDEMLKLLQTGHAVATIAQLKALGLAKGIYPLLDLAVERAETPFVAKALADTDRRVGEGKPVAPSFLLACILWSDVREGWAQRSVQQHPFPALQDAIDDVFSMRIGDVSGRGKLAADMREIWQMQPRFEKRVGATPFSVVEQPRFRAGFDFLRLRADAGELPEELATWWEDFSLETDEGREAMVAEQRAAAQAAQRNTPKAPAATKFSRAPRPLAEPHLQPGYQSVDDADEAPEGDDAPIRPANERGPARAPGERGLRGPGHALQRAGGYSGPPDGEPGSPSEVDTTGPAKKRRRRRKPGGARTEGDAGGSDA